MDGGRAQPVEGIAADDQAPAARLLHPILALFLKVLAGMSLLVAATAAVLGPTRTLLAAGANAALNLLLLWRLRRGYSQGAAFLSALGLLVVSLHAIARGSGIHDVGMVVVAVLMMLAALIEQRWQALVVMGGTVVGVWLVGAAKVLGWSKFDRGVTPAWDDVVVVTILLVSAAVLMRAVVARLRGGLVQLERSLERRQRLEAELQHAEQLRALGQLASGVAHDFNNQLTAIISAAEFLRRELGQTSSEAQTYVDEITAAAHRSADLTRQLLATARRAEPRQQALDVAALVHQVTGLLQRTLPRNIQVEVEAEPGSFTTRGDPSLLHSALLNLGVNARDAMAGGGTITFRLAHVTMDREEARRLELDPGAYLELSVTDTGTGMDADTLARIFDPFFTTKDAGTGLGLAAAYGTLRAHGGSLSVSSQPGQGSRFRLLLPISEPPRPSAASVPRSLSVLVVDGDPTVCESTARVLTRLGHRPSISVPRQALAALGKQAGGIQLVILDRAAAFADGQDLVAGLRAVAPGVPLLLLSGYGDASPAGGIQDLVVLGKPFGQDELAQAIASVGTTAAFRPAAGMPRTATPG
jgi:signal transduction histidine kinase/CheY-like chemotaxis protein